MWGYLLGGVAAMALGALAGWVWSRLGDPWLVRLVQPYALSITVFLLRTLAVATLAALWTLTLARILQ